MSAVDPDKVAGAIDVLSRLSWAKLFRLAVAAVFGACLFVAFEQRAQVLADLRGSPTLAIVMSCAALLLVLCAAFASLQSRIDDRTAAWHESLSEQIKELRAEVLRVSEAEKLCQERMILLLEQQVQRRTST